MSKLKAKERLQVLRIEHYDKKGLFRSETFPGSNISKVEDSMINLPPLTTLSSRHLHAFPVPPEDHDQRTGKRLNLCKEGREWFCAYKSVDQVKEWIKPEEMEAVIELGFKIFLLEVEEYQIGSYQVIYTKEGVRYKKDITELFKGGRSKRSRGF